MNRPGRQRPGFNLWQEATWGPRSPVEEAGEEASDWERGERQKDSIRVLIRTARWGKTRLYGQPWPPPHVHAPGSWTQSRPQMGVESTGR